MKKQIIMLSIIPFLLGNNVNATSEQSSQSFDTVLNAMMGPKFEKLDNDVKTIREQMNTFENKLGTLETKLSSFDPAKQVQQTNDQINNILDTKLIEIKKENESQDMQITNLKNEVNDLKTSNDDRNNKDLAEDEYNALIKASTPEARRAILDKYPKLKKVLGDDLEKYISGSMQFPANTKDILYSALSNDDAKLSDFMASDIISKLTSTSISLDDKKKLLEKHPEIKTLLGNPTDMDGYLNGTMQFPQDFDKKLSEKLSTPSSGQEASTEITSNTQAEATEVGQNANNELNSVTNNDAQLEKTKQEKFQEYANNLATEIEKANTPEDKLKIIAQNKQLNDIPEIKELIQQGTPISAQYIQDVLSKYQKDRKGVVPDQQDGAPELFDSTYNARMMNDELQQAKTPEEMEAILQKYPEISNMISEEDKKNLAKGIPLTSDVINNIKSKLSENLDNNNVPQTSNDSKKSYNNLVKGIANSDAAQERLGIKKFTDTNGNNVPSAETNDVNSSEKLENNYVEKKDKAGVSSSAFEKLSVPYHKYREAEDIDSQVLKKTKEKYKTLFEQTKAELEMAKADLKACEEKCKVSTEQLNQTNAALQQVTSKQVEQPEIYEPVGDMGNTPPEDVKPNEQLLQIPQPENDVLSQQANIGEVRSQQDLNIAQVPINATNQIITQVPVVASDAQIANGENLLVNPTELVAKPNVAPQTQVIEQPEIASNPNVVAVQPGAQSVAQPQGVGQPLAEKEQTAVDTINQNATPTGETAAVVAPTTEQQAEVPVQGINQVVTPTVETAAVVDPTTEQQAEVPVQGINQVVTTAVEPVQEGAQVVTPAVAPVQEGAQVVTTAVAPGQDGAQIATTAVATEQGNNQTVTNEVNSVQEPVAPGQESTPVVTTAVAPGQDGAQIATNTGETAAVVEPTTGQQAEAPAQDTNQVVTPTDEQLVEVPAQDVSQNANSSEIPNVIPEQNIDQIQEKPAEDVSMQNATVTKDNEPAQQEVAESGEGENQLNEAQNHQPGQEIQNMDQDVTPQNLASQNEEVISDAENQDEAQQYIEEDSFAYDDIQDEDFEQYEEDDGEELLLGEGESFEQEANAGVLNDNEFNQKSNEVEQIDEQVQDADQQQPDTQNGIQPNVEELAQVETEQPGNQNEGQPNVEGIEQHVEEQPDAQVAEQPQGEGQQQSVEEKTTTTEEQVQDENQQILAEHQTNERQVPSIEQPLNESQQYKAEQQLEEIKQDANQQPLENQGENQPKDEEQQLNAEQEINDTKTQTLEDKVNALTEIADVVSTGS
jgi:hypothetical protein